MIAIIAVPVDRRFRAKRMPTADNKFAYGDALIVPVKANRAEA